MSAIVGSKRDLKTAFSSTDANNLPHTSTSQQVQQAANLSFKDEARYKQVVREFRQIEHLDNTHAPKYAQCMLALNKLENFSELLNTFKRAKEKGKIDASVYAEYMDALIKSQQFKECLQIFEEAKQAGHLNEKVFGHYMLAANAIGQPQKAVDVLPEAESRAHINPYIYEQFILAANKLNLLLQIVNVRKRAELNGFVNPLLYGYFIHAAIKLKMYPEVIDIFTAARKRGHLNPTIYAYTMKATYIHKQFQYTMEFFHLAVENNHLNSFVCLYFMRAARELKNFEEIIDAFESADSRGYVHAEIYSIAITAANQLGQFEKVIAIFEKAQSTNENEFEANNCAQFLYAAAQLKKGADVRNVFEKIVTHRSADAELFFLALPFLSSAQSSHYVKRIESSTLGRIKLIAQLIKKNVSNEWVKEWAQKNENLLLPHPDAINDLVELSKKHEISSNDLNTWFKISREYQEGKIDFNPFFADSIPLIFFQNIFPLISANEIERLTPFSLEKGLKNLLRQNWTFTVWDSTDSNPPHLKIWFEKGLKKTGVETQTLLIKKALQYPDFIKSWHPQFLSDIFHDTITNPSQKDVWKKLLPILFIHLKQKNGTPIVEVLLKHLLIFDESIIRNIMNACKANSSPSTTTIYPTCSTLYKTCQSKLPPPPPPPPPPQSHYSVLELTKDAKADDIKKAYRKLALKLHPDKGGSEEKFKRLGEAFFVLSDPQKKQAYDLDLKSKPL